MFCYQCEQCAKGTGCTVVGVCGKDQNTANLQDLLLHDTMELAKTASAVKYYAEATAKIVIDNLFSTVTNVNFDSADIAELIRITRKEEYDIVRRCNPECGGSEGECHCGAHEASTPELLAEAASYSPQADIDKYGADLGGLKWLAVYGLKGMASYAHHAWVLGQKDSEVNKFFIDSLASLLEENITVESMLALNLKIGEVNLKVMELLDAANTGTYGHAEPTMVRVTPIKG